MWGRPSSELRRRLTDWLYRIRSPFARLIDERRADVPCLEEDRLEARFRGYGVILVVVMVMSLLTALLLSAGLQRLISATPLTSWVEE